MRNESPKRKDPEEKSARQQLNFSSHMEEEGKSATLEAQPLAPKSAVDSAKKRLLEITKNPNAGSITKKLQEAILFFFDEGKFEALMVLTQTNNNMLGLITHPQLNAFWHKLLSKYNLKRHRLDDQPAEKPDLLHPFKVITSVYCYNQWRDHYQYLKKLGKTMSHNHQKYILLKYGADFGGYECLDYLCHQDRLAIKRATQTNQELTTADLKPMVERVKKITALHFTAGWGAQSVFCCRLGQYFHKRLLIERKKKHNQNFILEDRIGRIDTSRSCHRLFSSRTTAVIAPDDIGILEDNHNYLAKRNHYYRWALQSIIVAHELHQHCNNILYNIKGSDDESLDDFCRWVPRDTSFHSMRKSYEELLSINTNQKSIIGEIERAASEQAKEIIGIQSTTPAKKIEIKLSC